MTCTNRFLTEIIRIIFLFIILIYEGNLICHQAEKIKNLSKYCMCVCAHICGFGLWCSADVDIEWLASKTLVVTKTGAHQLGRCQRHFLK